MTFTETFVGQAALAAPAVVNANRQPILFASDHHTYHRRIIQYDDRPFASVEEMNEEIRDRHNRVTGHDAICFFLGDFLIGPRKGFTENEKASVAGFIRSFNGRTIYYLEGNHEENMREIDLPENWVRLPPLWELEVLDRSPQRQRVVLCHYALRSWNAAHKGSLLLYGHSHQRLRSDAGDPMQSSPEMGRSMDVGINGNDYTPYTWDQVKEFMAMRRFHAVDHHLPRDGSAASH